MPRPTLVSLFTGIGGLDVGLERAGFEVVAAVEHNKAAREVLSRLRPEWPLLSEPDACALTEADWLEHLGRTGVDLLAGGPPCQPFSHAASWARPASAFIDERSDTVRAFFRTARWLKPRVLLIESVPGLAHHHMVRLHAFLGAVNRECGTAYRWNVFHVRASDWGVPQARRRVLLMADRDGREIELPSPTHAETPVDGQERWRTSWDALAPLGEPDVVPALAPTGRWSGLVPTIPEGENYLFHTPKGGGEPLFGWRTRYWAFLLKLAKNRPAWTLSANPGPAHGPFHWANRRLSERELAALQTFPLVTSLGVSSHVSQRLLGNAVPSALGELVGRVIGRKWLDRAWTQGLTLVPHVRDDCPVPTPVAPVPRIYRDAVKKPPEDHPGAGKGPGAAIRRAAGARLKRKARSVRVG
jgi:DNA (cytosine-5)-methyltransferase 1